MNILPLLIEAERYLTQKDVDRAAELYVRAEEQCAGLSPLPLVGLARIALLTDRTEDAKQRNSRISMRKFRERNYGGIGELGGRRICDEAPRAGKNHQRCAAWKGSAIR